MRKQLARRPQRAIPAPPDQRRRGVVTYSSGNHAQAVALAAQILNIPATSAMPHDAPATKLTATRSRGAHIVLYDRYAEDRETYAGPWPTARV
ncbi:pyridoxal-phosphate dependent enzyme [Nonomuraea sp. SYSU D8015]|uniref:pyridoxal-phosphate dependent enzyme n=1 Tax=Nonomuraea sp. SYSU D8015 TaxID=2593644 RepID=UPI001CB706BC|nr:pyridoxal-phosphate dependent enzyme [Nonomuraea sp. SYSU D8015]